MICPFSSSVDGNGITKLSPCLQSCALFMKGMCCFRIIAEKSLRDIQKENKTLTSE